VARGVSTIFVGAHQLCSVTSAGGHGGEDLAAVITTLERLAGLRV